MKVALIGSRGIPNRYGGYETLMEELATRLVARGFQVTVYCRSHSTPRSLKSWQGADLVVLPTLARDLGALAYVLLRERSSLSAYSWLWRNRRDLLRRRRLIQERKKVSVDRWFGVDGMPV